MIASAPGKIIVQIVYGYVENTGPGERYWAGQAGERYLWLVGYPCLAAGLPRESVMERINLIGRQYCGASDSEAFAVIELRDSRRLTWELRSASLMVAL